MSEKGFIRKKVCEIFKNAGFDIRPSTIQFYTDNKLIIPGEENPTGKGTNRKYNEKNLLEILIARELNKSGVTLHDIKGILGMIETITQYMDGSYRFLYLYFRDDKVQLAYGSSTDKINEGVIRGFNKLIVLNVSQLWENLKPALP